jgi:outer membrane protein insertion porin family
MNSTTGFQRLTRLIVRIVRWNPSNPVVGPRTTAVLLAVLLSGAAALSAQELESAFFGKILRSITYSSDQPLNRSHYDPYLGIKPGDVLTRTTMKRAIQALYESGRFAYISVEGLAEGDGVGLRFNLRNNYYFNRFYVEGKVNLKGRALWEWIPLPTGQRFTGEKLEESLEMVSKFMKERGFYRAQVKARTVSDENKRQVDVFFAVQPGTLSTIRSVEITGVPDQEMEVLRDKFGYREGKKFDRSRLSGRLDNLRKYFIKKGYLAAVAQATDTFDPAGNDVVLKLDVANFGRVRVVVEGFKIDKNQLRRLLPVLVGEGVNEEILEEGADNLREYLENRGYPEADISISDKPDSSGVRVFRYLIVPNQKFTVAYVRFRDNHVFTDQEMLSSIEIQPAKFLQKSAYSVKRLDDDVDSLKALYESRGYLEAKVIPLIEPLKDAEKLGITYLCNEGRISRTRSININGNSALTTQTLTARIQMAPGGPYSPSLAERARQSVLAAYSDAGYLQSRVTVRAGLPDKENSYPVEFQIEEGSPTIVDRILVVGNERTRNSLIDKRIKIKENEPLSLGRLLQTQQALHELGIFDQVRVTPQTPDSLAPYQDVVVRLQEAKRYTVRYGIGYQTREKVRGTVELSTLNFLGTARLAEIRFQGSSVEQKAVFSLRKPQFRPLPVDSYFTFSALHSSDVSFDSRRFNVAYQYSQPFGGHSWGLLRYSFKNVRLLELRVSPSELERKDTPVNLTTLSIAYVNDTRDNHLDPERGFFTSTDLGVTTKPGSNNYVSFYSQNSYYRRLSQSLMTAFSLRVGLAQPFGGDVELPISERFFAGGGSSLRGFDTDYAGPLDPVTNKPLGGNALLIGSAELRIPLLRFIHLAGFYDTGNVFPTPGDIRLPDFSHTVGMGLRIKTPFGPLRADYGYNVNLPADLQQRGLTRGHLFVTVGQPF